jgi:UDP-glucose 4-epimerase
MILVTGHKGYIGSRLYKTLKERECGHTIYGIDLKAGQNILKDLPTGPFDYIFHVAANPRVEDSIKRPSHTLEHNVLATSKILELAKNSGTKRVIFSSSSAIYGDGDGPLSPYGLHKLMSEMECRLYSQLYGVDTVCLRYFNVFSQDQPYGGSYSTVISAWMEMIRYNNSLRLDGDGEQTRDYVHVEDVVAANIFAMNYKERFDGDYFDVGTGISISLNEIKNVVNQFHKVEWQRAPTRPGDARSTRANIQKIKNLGWKANIDSRLWIEKCFKEI